MTTTRTCLRAPRAIASLITVSSLANERLLVKVRQRLSYRRTAVTIVRSVTQKGKSVHLSQSPTRCLGHRTPQSQFPLTSDLCRHRPKRLNIVRYPAALVFGRSGAAD